MSGGPRTTRRRALALIGATTAATAGCLTTADTTSENDTDEGESEIEVEDDAQTPAEGHPLRGFNFIPDSDTIDFHTNDTLLLPEVEMVDQGFTTRFVSEDNAESDAHITRGGDAHTTPLATATVGAGAHTLVAIGELCRLGRDPALIALEDDFSSLSNRNTHARARVRVIHAAPDTPTFDIEVDGETPYQDMAFGDAQYAEVSAGERIFTVQHAASGEKIAAFQFDLPPGHVCTAFAIGYQDLGDAPSAVPDDFSFAMGIVDDGPVTGE